MQGYASADIEDMRSTQEISDNVRLSLNGCIDRDIGAVVLQVVITWVITRTLIKVGERIDAALHRPRDHTNN